MRKRETSFFSLSLEQKTMTLKPLVQFTDMDPSAYMISANETTVSIFGAAKFSTSPDWVSFDLCLTRADSEEPEGGAFISFNDEELHDAGLGLALETVEAAVLSELRSSGFLTRELIDNYLEPRQHGAGSNEYLITASGWSFCGDAYNEERKDCRIDYYAFLTYWSECTEAAATDCRSWADVEGQLSGYVPETALHAVKRWHFFNRTDWANIENLY